jgi:hypothetical protein
MKKILLSAAVLFVSIIAFAQKKMADVAKFKSETIEFGKVKQGVPAEGVFTITNISSEPIIIEQANPTCGCTIADYTKTPIAPGKTGEIKAKYNAANAGSFDKHLTVKLAGIDEVKQISLKGEVVASEEFDKGKVASDSKVKESPASETIQPVKAQVVKPVTKPADKKVKKSIEH